MIPASLIETFRSKIATLNEALKHKELRISRDFPLIDPVIIGDFEVTQHKYFRNPHEHVDLLIREDTLAEVTRKLVGRKERIF